MIELSHVQELDRRLGGILPAIEDDHDLLGCAGLDRVFIMELHVRGSLEQHDLLVGIILAQDSRRIRQVKFLGAVRVNHIILEFNMALFLEPRDQHILKIALDHLVDALDQLRHLEIAQVEADAAGGQGQGHGRGHEPEDVDAAGLAGVQFVVSRHSAVDQRAREQGCDRQHERGDQRNEPEQQPGDVGGTELFRADQIQQTAPHREHQGQANGRQRKGLEQFPRDVLMKGFDHAEG